jgi:hypothetical protein
MPFVLLVLRRWWPYLLLLLALAGLTAAWLRWLHGHDARIRVEQQLAGRDTVIQWRTDTAAARSDARRVDSVMVADILTKVKRDTLWRHDTVHVAGDTTPRIAIPLGTLTAHDTAFARCERLNRSCAAEHAADSLLIRDLRASVALARTGTATPAPTPVRHWYLGITAGYGGTLARDTTGARRVYAGPSLVVGATWTPF